MNKFIEIAGYEYVLEVEVNALPGDKDVPAQHKVKLYASCKIGTPHYKEEQYVKGEDLFREIEAMENKLRSMTKNLPGIKVRHELYANGFR